MINPVLDLILLLLNLYWWVVVASVVASWLVAFNVINTHNNFAASILRALYALTEPVFRPIRNILPNIGGLDLSPLIVLIGIWFLQRVIVSLYVSSFRL